MRSLTTPPTVSPTTPAKEHARREKRRFLQVELVLVQEERRNPVEVEPQDPAVAEVRRRHRHHALRAAARTARRASCWRGVRPAVWQSPRARYAGGSRIIAEVDGPYQHPQKRDAADDDERPAPRVPCHQRSDQRRRQRISEASKRMGDACAKARRSARHPGRHSPCGGGKRRRPHRCPAGSERRTSDMAPSTKPMRTVAADQIVPQMMRVMRGPRRSPSQPPAIWKKA